MASCVTCSGVRERSPRRTTCSPRASPLRAGVYVDFKLGSSHDNSPSVEALDTGADQGGDTRSQLSREKVYAGQVATRPGEAADTTELDGSSLTPKTIWISVVAALAAWAA